MERDDLTAWLRLTLTPGVGNATARRLLQTFGLPQQIFQQTAAALQQCVRVVGPGITVGGYLCHHQHSDHVLEDTEKGFYICITVLLREWIEKIE